MEHNKLDQTIDFVWKKSNRRLGNIENIDFEKIPQTKMSALSRLFSYPDTDPKPEG